MVERGGQRERGSLGLERGKSRETMGRWREDEVKEEKKLFH